MMAYVNPELAA